MVATRRRFEGVLQLASMTRLRDSLVDAEGDVHVSIEFDRDTYRVPYAELRIDAELPLECQRSLRRFLFPVRLVQRLGMIGDEADEAGLPEGYEALLLPEGNMLRPAELVEDELILAVPVIPVAPGTEAMEHDWPANTDENIAGKGGVGNDAASNPFAALAALKPDKNLKRQP